jgi:hypothetical protein
MGGVWGRGGERQWRKGEKGGGELPSKNPSGGFSGIGTSFLLPKAKSGLWNDIVSAKLSSISTIK